MRLGVEAAIVHGELVPGDVEVVDGVVADVGLAAGRRGRIAVPGFVDLQVNGFGGVDFLAAGGDDYARDVVRLVGEQVEQQSSAADVDAHVSLDLVHRLPGPCLSS